MMKCIFIISSVFASFGLDAQNVEQMLAAGDKAYEEKNYYTALNLFQTAIEKGESSIHYYFAAAEAARHLNAFGLASEFYQKALRKEEEKQYPLIRYHLGTVLWRQGKYGQARSLMSNFVDRYDGSNPYYVASAQNILAQLDYAENDEKISSEIFTVRQMDSEFNSEYSETAPVQIYDRLYFTALKYKDDKNAHLVARPLYSLDNEMPVEDLRFGAKEEIIGNLAFDDTDNMVYYSKCHYNDSTEIVCNIYSRHYAEELGPENQLTATSDDYTTTQPTLASVNGEKYLIYASNRPGGSGGLDLWMSHINPNGKLESTKNLREINTIANESTPYFSKEYERLYFSSEGLTGSGGYDIFQSNWTNSTFSNPINLGKPVNSSYDDLYFSIRDSVAYMSSNRPSSTYLDSTIEACCFDLYRIDVTSSAKLILSFYDEKDEPLTEVQITMENESERAEFQSKKSNKIGLVIKPNQTYAIQASKDGIVSDWINIETSGLEFGQVVEEKVIIDLSKESPSKNQKP